MKWNIVCNNNLDYLLKVNCDILMNNIYTKNAVSLNSFCLRAYLGGPVHDRKLYIYIYIYLIIPFVTIVNIRGNSMSQSQDIIIIINTNICAIADITQVISSRDRNNSGKH